jgi:hypothetical protein
VPGRTPRSVSSRVGLTHPLIAELLGLGLPEGDWALFGSGPLLVRGWIDEVGDLDVISRGAAWDKARGLGHPETIAGGIETSVIGSNITVGTSWAYGDPEVDDLIDTAEMIDGVPCVTIDHVVAYKRIADRPKDRAHLALIEANS